MKCDFCKQEMLGRGSNLCVICSEQLKATALELLEVLEQTADCLADMMAGRGGWAWEEVLEEARQTAAKAKGQTT